MPGGHLACGEQARTILVFFDYAVRYAVLS